MRRALLRQNPHTYWGMLKCFLWYRASMIEGTHPMVTGFFRLKDRLNRRPGPADRGPAGSSSGAACARSAHMTLGYAKLLLEMQELWVATRIRREDYAFLGDLRRVRQRGAAALVEVKTNWGRLHAMLAARAARLTGRDAVAPAQPAAGPSASLRDRFEAVWTALGSRAEALSHSDEAGTAGVSARDERSWAEFLGALRLPALSPVRASRPARWLRRLSVFRAPTLETRRRLTAYWGRTSDRVRRFEWWRLNPISLAWNGARDLKNMLVFIQTMTHERH